MQEKTDSISFLFQVLKDFTYTCHDWCVIDKPRRTYTLLPSVETGNHESRIRMNDPNSLYHKPPSNVNLNFPQKTESK